MAASTLPRGGYICNFVEDIPEDFYCLLCQHVARDPHITSCCGEHFCRTCITPFLQEKQPCPHCSAEEFATLLNVKYQHTISSFHIYCKFEDRGCKWVGLLSGLDKHTTSECQFLETECPNLCGEKVTRNRLEEHLETECFQRRYTCPYCSHQGTYKSVANEHMEKCPYFPVRCPNFCGVTCERDTFKNHMLICPLEKVECELAFAGCKEKFLRDNQESHSQEYHEQHLSLLSKECSRMKKEFQQGLKEKDQLIETLQASYHKELHAKQNQIQKLQQKLEEMEINLRHTSETLDTVSFFRFPAYFTIYNYKEQKAIAHNRWLSRYIRTHPMGYAFQVVVHLNGVGEGAGTHISVSLLPNVAKVANLKWPAKFTITLQLLNQFHDQDHMTVTEMITWKPPMHIVSLSRLFVRHEELEWNAKKLTQYLREDTLQFRITKINVLSM